MAGRTEMTALAGEGHKIFLSGALEDLPALLGERESSVSSETKSSAPINNV